MEWWMNEPEYQPLLDDPSTPTWVHNLIEQVLVKRDSVDVVNALDLLCAAANKRAWRITLRDIPGEKRAWRIANGQAKP